MYLVNDVLLLADGLESFVRMALETCKLDPAHYVTGPGLLWEAMLKVSQGKLELIDDPDIYLMIESRLRGGVSMITKKHAVANNPLVAGQQTNQLLDVPGR